MNFFSQLYYSVLFQPLFNGLIFLYFVLHDLGLAVIVLTLIIKLLLMPSSIKAFKSQRQIQTLQPKIKELQNKYKDDKAQQSKEMFALYKKEGVSPAGGCLPLLLQLPIIIALYQVFIKISEQKPVIDILYSFTPKITNNISPLFLGLVDFKNTAFVVVVALLAAIAQFWQGKTANNLPTSQNKKVGLDFSATLQKQMMFMLPLLSFFLIWKFGALIGLYWLTSSAFSLLEQFIISKKNYGKKIN